MENLYLKFPTLEDKDKWIDYINEYRLSSPNASPLGYSIGIDYEDWLERREKEHLGIDLEEGRVPASAYFLMCGDRIVGNVDIRHNLENEYLAEIAGHIGYSIRPSERRKGYATIMLNLALEKCEEFGIKDVMVTCKANNVGSAKTIENNLGVLSKTVFYKPNDCKFKIYWINVKEALDNKDVIRSRKSL